MLRDADVGRQSRFGQREVLIVDDRNRALADDIGEVAVLAVQKRAEPAEVQQDLLRFDSIGIDPSDRKVGIASTASSTGEDGARGAADQRENNEPAHRRTIARSER